MTAWIPDVDKVFRSNQELKKLFLFSCAMRVAPSLAMDLSVCKEDFLVLYAYRGAEWITKNVECDDDDDTPLWRWIRKCLDDVRGELNNAN